MTTEADLTATDLDIDELAKSLAPQPLGCRVGAFIRSLTDGKVAAKVAHYLESHDYPQTAAVVLVKRLGGTVGEKAVRRHRHRECSCFQ